MLWQCISKYGPRTSRTGVIARKQQHTPDKGKVRSSTPHGAIFSRLHCGASTNMLASSFLMPHAVHEIHVSRIQNTQVPCTIYDRSGVAGTALRAARKAKERVYPELLRSTRCWLVVLAALEAAGRWSLEVLARCGARAVPPAAHSAAIAAFTIRVASILAFAAAFLFRKQPCRWPPAGCINIDGPAPEAPNSPPSDVLPELAMSPAHPTAAASRHAEPLSRLPAVCGPGLFVTRISCLPEKCVRPPKAPLACRPNRRVGGARKRCAVRGARCSCARGPIAAAASARGVPFSTWQWGLCPDAEDSAAGARNELGLRNVGCEKVRVKQTYSAFVARRTRNRFSRMFSSARETCWGNAGVVYEQAWSPS